MSIDSETVIGGEGLSSRTRAVDNALVDRRVVRLTLRMRVGDDDGDVGGGGGGSGGGDNGGGTSDDGDGDREMLVIGSDAVEYIGVSRRIPRGPGTGGSD